MSRRSVLPKREAKLRADAVRAIGLSMKRLDRAFVATLHNRRRTALRFVDCAYDALMGAEGLLRVWDRRSS